MLSVHTLSNKFFKCSLGALLALLMCGVGTALLAHAQASIIYVDQSASGANDGTSWGDAYNDLQAALAVAVSGDEIWVATGVYTPGLSQSDTFTLTSGVQLYGGFAATETTRGQRDWVANPTVLSGDIAGDDTTDAHGVVTTTEHISGSNSNHVVWAAGVSSPITASTVLDGFSISAGQANGDWPHTNGGGLYCDGAGAGNECSPSLGNLTLSGNSADIYGGALYNYGSAGGESSPSLNDVTLSNNLAGSDGGAMHNEGSGGESSPSLSDVTFSGNHAATNGGAMFNDSRGNGLSRPSLTNVTFSNNSAGVHGGAMFNDGASGGESSPSLVNVTFLNNKATTDGGALYNHGDDGVSQPWLNRVVFAGNSADGGGGALRNQASGSSGVCQPTIINAAFSGNTALYGGAMYNCNAQPNIVNATLADNSAEDGGAIWNTCTSHLSLNNVILWGNTATYSGTQIYNGATISISFTLIQSDANAIINAGGTMTYGANILSDDPNFINALGTDSISGTLDDDLQLQPLSPAIDAGNNAAVSASTDLDGNPRFYDDAVVADSGNGTPPIADLGAFERQSDSCTAYSVIYVDRDATGDDDGTTWANAFTDLQDGLALARACAPLEVWVATGVYTPGLSQGDTFTLTSGIALYGGFAGTENLRSQRNYTANLTILSGDIAGDDAADANCIVTSTDNISGSNSFHVVWADGVTKPVTASTVLDGFTISAGQANGSGDDRGGGGLYCAGVGAGSECSPSLNNLTFSGNTANLDAGALYNDGYQGTSSPSLRNVVFSGNAGRWGGAMANNGWSGVSSPSLVNVTFANNTASNGAGGGMYNNGYLGSSSPSLSDVTFSGNSARVGGALYGYSEDGDSSPSLVNVTFYSNTASVEGGALANESWYNGDSSPSLINVTFSGNTVASGSGGAMYNAAWEGGLCNPHMTNVTFSGNVVDGNGGALYNYAENSGSVSSPSLVNVTFSGNTASSYGGALFNGSDSDGASTTSLSNVILWGNTATTGTQIYNLTATFNISYSLIQSDTNAIVNSGASSVTYGGNILSADPLFVDTDGADDVSGTLDDDLRLRPGSPALDTGDNSVCPATDILGVSRPQGAACDMGAYEREYLSLTVVHDGAGSGVVVSDPAGIDCAASGGASCSASFVDGAVITLTATAASDSTFTGWSGAGCSGAGACVVTLDAAQTITAAFDLLPRTLTVNVVGN